MVSRRAYLRKIRSLGYRFKRDAKRIAFYRIPGTTKFATVPRKGDLAEGFVRVELGRMGLTESEVETFIESSLGT